MAEKIYELPNGKKYALDLDNPEHYAWLEEAAKEAPENTVGRQLGLTARSAVKGVAAVPGIMADAVTGVYNTAADKLNFGGFRFPQTQSALDSLLSKAGLPEPYGKLETLVSKGTEAGFGAGGLAGMAKNAPAGLAALGENVGGQVAAATAGALGAE